MLFPTLSFAAFFAVVLPVSWLLMPHRVRWRVFMVAASWFFYGAADWRFVPLLAGSTVVNQFFARTIDRSSGLARKRWTVVAVASNLAVLAWFKYVGFLSLTLQSTLRDAGLHAHVPLPEVVLPVGISFFTFQALSYVIDTSRRKIEPSPLLDFAVYLSFFPHLIAGPIVRAAEFLPQIKEKIDPRKVDVARAFWLISLGLFKKVVIASYLGTYAADPLFGYPHQHAGIEALFGVYAYAIQIYMDFSGYTDIAIGLALLLGIRFPQNFNAPYAAASLQDFWRRWHMTLSRWLRDYLYIPLGGNRRGRVRTYVNIMITMLLGGLWHGAAWTFVAWGALHGIGLCVERWRHQDAAKEAPPAPVPPTPSTPQRVEVAAPRRPTVVHAASAEAPLTARVATLERSRGARTAEWWLTPSGRSDPSTGELPLPRHPSGWSDPSTAELTLPRHPSGRSDPSTGDVPLRPRATNGHPPPKPGSPPPSPGSWPPPLPATAWRPRSADPATPTAPSISSWRPRPAGPTGPPVPPAPPVPSRSAHAATTKSLAPPGSAHAATTKPLTPSSSSHAAATKSLAPPDSAHAATTKPLTPPGSAYATDTVAAVALAPPPASPSTASPPDAVPQPSAPPESASPARPASAEVASGNGRPAGRRPLLLSPVARRWIGWLVTFHVVCFAWIFFRATSFHNAVEVLGRIGDLGGRHQPFNWKAAAIVVAALAMQLGPRGGGARLQALFSRCPLWGQALILVGVLTVIDLMGPAGVAPFIYFRF
ncbi:MAG TPA: MBOAT family O-acyltransferase [Acidimicrobiales bacterium]|jgi:D-alanyl-lipoteichoic acid acyltransferase DltB (MBOAT superfamily)|nr:MBOAT family O-acyltransferase [Acidimicrobiales bacterium]